MQTAVAGETPRLPGLAEARASFTPAEARVASAALDAMRRLSAEPGVAPTAAALRTPEVRARVAKEMRRILAPGQGEIADLGTISIPRIVVIPPGRGLGRFQPFRLDLAEARPTAAGDTLRLQELLAGAHEVRAGLPLEPARLRGVAAHADLDQARGLCLTEQAVQLHPRQAQGAVDRVLGFVVDEAAAGDLRREAGAGAATSGHGAVSPAAVPWSATPCPSASICALTISRS